MKSFSVNLTRAEWLEVLYVVGSEIDALAPWIAGQQDLGWPSYSAAEVEFFEDGYLRLLSVRNKINKKLDENA